MASPLGVLQAAAQPGRRFASGPWARQGAPIERKTDLRVVLGLVNHRPTRQVRVQSKGPRTRTIEARSARRVLSSAHTTVSRIEGGVFDLRNMGRQAQPPCVLSRAGSFQPLRAVDRHFVQPPWRQLCQHGSGIATRRVFEPGDLSWLVSECDPPKARSNSTYQMRRELSLPSPPLAAVASSGAQPWGDLLRLVLCEPAPLSVLTPITEVGR